MLSWARVRNYLQKFNLAKLFTEELGWDRHSGTLEVAVDGEHFELRALAQKRGVQIFECQPDCDGYIPDYAARRKIEKQVTKTAYEHLIIFVDGERSTQIWQWVAREPGEPAAYREHPYHKGQSGDSLIQKLETISFPLDEEEAIDLTTTVHKLRDAFDRDRLTKQFYDHFKREHGAFLDFIEGITEQGDREWYASLMLNRLMFVYFIQRKGFLDGDTHYLKNRLHQVQQQTGNGNFHTFYRYFLLKLFHEGFAKQPPQRELSPALTTMLGKIPYLNGGLFELHELEQKHDDIDIPDEAFERLFAFFDQYDWHLDNRPLRQGNEINPDVLGYIFEKYINQKQMGAYYTKEDITDYISKNTIIPYLFDAARKQCAIAFKAGSALWKLLQETPDRYIYPAVRKGVIDDSGDVIPLPEHIGEGIEDVGKRDGWNRAADPEFALPTETWREHVARRKRCLEIREKLTAGEIHDINDLITYNLNIRQFAEDVIESCEGPELLRAFYQAIRTVTVLDPACGSGAFLFAALNILEPLYETCLTRMQGFVEDLRRTGERHSPKKFEDYRKILADIERHANRNYFIFKSIIVHNLYGVDIMEEAVEICKLRLFLKLVAQVDPKPNRENYGLEPLPDIDFNIRPGNTLVGFATLDDVKATMENTLEFGQEEVDRIVEDAEVIERAFRKFHEMQTEHDMNAREFAADKQRIRKRLTKLSAELDRYLAGEYSVAADDSAIFQKWRKSHEPFHWFAEFFGIMRSGGFDVIIGNPPWKEYSSIRRVYQVQHFETLKCGNLHGIFSERSLSIRSSLGRFSFIVQLPLASSSRMETTRRVLRNQSSQLHVIPFGDRPGKLFDGLQNCRSVIFLSKNGSRKAPILFSTRYQRWPTETRPVLFPQIEFACVQSGGLFPTLFPKYAKDTEVSVFEKLRKNSDTSVGEVTSNSPTNAFVFYQEATQYWVKATIGLPYYAKNGMVGAPAHGRYVYCDGPKSTAVVSAILNSTLFYSYFIAFSDCFHLSNRLVSSFPIPSAILRDEELIQFGEELQQSLADNAVRKRIQTGDGSEIIYDEFYASVSKSIIDRIDERLAAHLAFSKEELESIVNYDFKYRLGLDEGDD